MESFGLLIDFVPLASWLYSTIYKAVDRDVRMLSIH